MKAFVNSPQSPPLISWGKVRIIGGCWRGRVLRFPTTVHALKPTKDYVRETLFNWLEPFIRNAICLDPFAGTGILGFEALSRGAQCVCMIERHQLLYHLLQKHTQQLRAEKASNTWGRFPDVKPHCPGPFDVIFLDPPFRLIPWFRCLPWLQEHHYLHENTIIYVESDQPLDISLLKHENPNLWRWFKKAQSGGVFFGLIGPSATNLRKS